jgi:DNA-binding NarL/FixJ family response regulator
VRWGVVWYDGISSWLDILYDDEMGEETVTELRQIWGENVKPTAGKGMNSAVLILARQGPLRDSLRSFLAAAPWIEAVHLSEDVLSAVRMITLHRPALVLVADDLPADGVSMVLRWIKSEGSCSRSLVLAEDSQQRQEALTLGADAALLKGFPAAGLFKIIERLVTRPAKSEASRA